MRLKRAFDNIAWGFEAKHADPHLTKRSVFVQVIKAKNLEMSHFFQPFLSLNPHILYLLYHSFENHPCSSYNPKKHRVDRAVMNFSGRKTQPNLVFDQNSQFLAKLKQTQISLVA